ncbi:MAG: hypothetical protein ACLTTW_03695 [Coprobacter sp.]
MVPIIRLSGYGIVKRYTNFKPRQATMAKQQNAIAINAYKDVLIEKFTGFQSSFLTEGNNLPTN